MKMSLNAVPSKKVPWIIDLLSRSSDYLWQQSTGRHTVVYILSQLRCEWYAIYIYKKHH